MMGFGFLMMLFVIAVPIAALVGLGAVIIWLVRGLLGGSIQSIQSIQSNQSPREILQARYARGEITRDQYTQRLQDLG